jgi:hypothetical protein
MRLGDVVDQLHDDHGLADPGAAEQADLSALHVGRQQVDDLDAGDELFGLGRLLDEFRGRAMDRIGLLRSNRAALVDRFADDVDDAAQRLRSNRHVDRRARVLDFLAAHKTFGRVHRDAAHRAFAEMLRDFENQRLVLVFEMQRIEDLRKLAIEMHVDHGAHHLCDTSYDVLRHQSAPVSVGRVITPRHRK